MLSKKKLLFQILSNLELYTIVFFIYLERCPLWSFCRWNKKEVGIWSCFAITHFAIFIVALPQYRVNVKFESETDSRWRHTGSRWRCAMFITDIRKYEAWLYSVQTHSLGLLNREYVYSVAVYQKNLTRFGRIDHFRALARKLSFLPTKLMFLISFR